MRVRAVAIRAALVRKFLTTRQFKRLASRHDHFIERHTGEALQAFFFNRVTFRGRPECYVSQADAQKLLPFMPVLEALAIDGASLGAAIVATALLDAVVFPEFSSFGVALAEAWMAHFKLTVHSDKLRLSPCDCRSTRSNRFAPARQTRCIW